MTHTISRWLTNFFRPPKEARVDLNRRHVLAAGIVGLSTGLLFHKRPAALDAPQQGTRGPAGGLFYRPEPVVGNRAFTVGFIRPPGSVGENSFLNKCIRCGECMKVCPTNTIQPAFLETGLEGLWSPILNTRLGYCEYKCTMCTQVCPTEAIQKVPLEKKQKIKIGLAAIDHNRCLPYAYGKNCTVCQEQCPLQDKAIKLVAASITSLDGKKTIKLKQPHVDSDLCTGCGACENKCPVPGTAAIRVTGLLAS